MIHDQNEKIPNTLKKSENANNIFKKSLKLPGLPLCYYCRCFI